MIITIGQKQFQLVEVDEKPKKTRDEMIKEVLEIPKSKNVKLGPCQVPGLPRCISSQEFRDHVKEIEDRKEKKREEIDKRKAEWKTQVEQNRAEKQKAAEACKAKNHMVRRLH